MWPEKLSDTAEVPRAKRGRCCFHCCHMVAVPRFRLLMTPLLHRVRLDNSAGGREDAKVPREHIAGRLSESMSIVPKIAELAR